MISIFGRTRALLPIAILAVTVVSCGTGKIAEKSSPIYKQLKSVPATPANLDAAIKRGVDFLVANQRPNGSWGSSRIRGGVPIMAPISGGHDSFKAACTALSLMSLSESGDKRPGVTAAIDKGAKWLRENAPKVKRSETTLYCNWAYAYTIRASLLLIENAPAKLKEEYSALIKDMIVKLERFEFQRGGWGYYAFDILSRRSNYNPNSFMTGTVLVALKSAENAGYKVSKNIIRRALNFMRTQRIPNGCYMYSSDFQYAPAAEINRTGGSLARSQVGHLALYLYNDKDTNREVLADWVNKIIVKNGWLDQGRKTYMPHEGQMGVAGYFYYYGHYYAGLSLEQLSDEKRKELSTDFAKIILTRQQSDGSWFDFIFYDYSQYSSTPFSLMALLRCKGYLVEQKAEAQAKR